MATAEKAKQALKSEETPKREMTAKELAAVESYNSRANLIDTVAQAVLKDRNATYGTPEDNFQTIAEFWNVWLLKRFGIRPALTALDVSMMMDLVKTARLSGNIAHLDSWVDKAGYSVCGGGLLAFAISKSQVKAEAPGSKE